MRSTKIHKEGMLGPRSNQLVGNFQASLESLRLKRGLNRRGFAELIGVPQSSYFNLISKNANPCLETITNIAVRAGIDPCELLQPRDKREQGENATSLDATTDNRTA